MYRYLKCDIFLISSGFISLCLFTFLTASSKCPLDTRASEDNQVQALPPSKCIALSSLQSSL